MPVSLCRNGTEMVGMVQVLALPEEYGAPAGSGLRRKILVAFAGLALASAAISLGGRWLGHWVSMAGHTESRRVFEVVIGNDVLHVPANTIRQPRARRDGTAERLDLYVNWPALDGYTEAARDDFNNAGDRPRILFLGFEARSMSRDMSGRLEPVYAALLETGGTVGPAGLVRHRFRAGSGYAGEELLTADRPGQTPYVARCLAGAAAQESLAPCERDVEVGRGLSLTYRFPAHLLEDWRALDDAVARKADLWLAGRNSG